MTMLKTTVWDPAEHLRSKKDIVAFLQAAFEDGDSAVIAAALGYVARSKGMAKIAKSAGLTREGLYRSLSANGNPELDTVMKVTKSLGLQLTVKPVGKAA
jgi:probable addiction module antidote protein